MERSKTQLKVLMIADELEKLQKENVKYKDSDIWQKMALAPRTYQRLKSKALAELQKRAKIRETALNSTITLETIEKAKNGLKSTLELEEQLCRIAMGDIEVTETTLTPDGMIDHQRKPSPSEMTAAIRELLKLRGAYAPEKIDHQISQYQVTLNLK
jgi:hypothetical protein